LCQRASTKIKLVNSNGYFNRRVKIFDIGHSRLEKLRNDFSQNFEIKLGILAINEASNNGRKRVNRVKGK
jgi:hypothetical protein